MTLEEQRAWLQRLEQNTDQLIEEYKSFTGRKPTMPGWDNGLYGAAEGWFGIPLWWTGRPITRFQKAFPVASSLLTTGPAHLNTGMTITQPGCRVPSHNHLDLGAYIFLHLPLIIPSGDVYFEVDSQVHRWQVGKLFAFDCRQQHTSWNNTDRERVILITEFARDQWIDALQPYMPLTPTHYEPTSNT